MNNKNNCSYYLNRGIAYSLLAKDEYTLQDFTSAITFSQDLNKKYFYYRGEAYFRLGNFDNAKRDFRRALSLDPYYHCARDSITRIHQTKYEEEYSKQCVNKMKNLK